MLSQKTQKYILIISGIALLAGCIAHILKNETGVYIFSAGAIGLTFIKIKNLAHSTNFRIKRLQKMLGISSLLLVGTVYLMYTKNNIWVLTLILSAILDLVVSYRMPDDGMKNEE